MKEIFNWIVDNWETGLGIAAILYELIMRLAPTEKNKSLIDLIFKILNAVLPNVRKTKVTDSTKVVDFTEKDKPLNEVKVRTDRHIVKTLLILFLLSVGITANAQTNVTGKLISSVNADSVLSKTVAQNLFNTYGAQSGSLYYNYQANKWRITEDSAGVLVWRDLVSGSGGGGGTGTVNGANNGLHLSTDGTEVRFGGTLANDTLITGSAVLTFSNTNTQFNSGTLGLRNPGNTFRYNFLGSAIVANRDITIPLLTGNDTFTFNSFAATLTNKTLGSGTVFSVDPTINSGVKFTFVPTATIAGISVGSLAGNPSTNVSGNLWYNSSAGYLGAHISGAVAAIPYYNTAAGDFVANQVSWIHGVSGRLSSASNFVYAATTLTTPINLALGASSDATTTQRTIIPQGTQADIGLRLSAKGGENILISNSSAASFTTTIQGNGIGAAVFSLTGSGNTLTLGGTSSVPGNITANGATSGTAVALNVHGGDGNTGTVVGGDLTLRPGLGNGGGANGNLIITNIPTSSAGLPSGAIWSNAGVLTIVP